MDVWASSRSFKTGREQWNLKCESSMLELFFRYISVTVWLRLAQRFEFETILRARTILQA